MPELIVVGPILVGGLIMAAAAIAMNVVFARYVIGPRRTPAADRTARLIGSLTFVDTALRLALVAWVGLTILFLGLIFEGKPGWTLAIPFAMLVWTAAVQRYVQRLLRRARG